MAKRNRDRAFTDGRCHTLDVAAPDVAHGEHAWTRRFKQVRRTLEWPLRSSEIVTREVRSSFYEALSVERDVAGRAAQPPRIRLCTGHQEHVPDLVTRDGSAAGAPRDRFQAPVSLERHDLRSRSDLDRRGLFDTAKEISRHALRKTVRSNEDMNAPACPCQKHRRLTSGVGTADDDRLIVVAELRVLHECRVVVDADTFEPTEILDRWFPVPGSCGNDHGAGRNRGAVLEFQGVGVSFAGQLGGTLRDHDLCAELLRLG